MISSKTIATGGLLLYLLVTITLSMSEVCIQDVVKMTRGVSIFESTVLLLNALRIISQVMLHGSTENHLYTNQMDILILICVINVSI